MKKLLTIFSCALVFSSLAQNDSLGTIDLMEVTVSSVPLGERLKFSTQQVAVLDQTKLKYLSQPSLAEVLSQSGQVLVQKSQLGGGSPIVRGFEANKVLLVLDGVRMNNAIYRGGHLQNVMSVDNNFLDKVDLLFGSQSVAYGSDAFGGVLHFHTIKPLRSGSSAMVYKTNLMTRYGTAMNEKTVSGQVQGGNNRFGFATSISYSDFGDLVQGSVRKASYPEFGKLKEYVIRVNDRDSVVGNENQNLQKNSGYTQFDFLQKLEYRPDDNSAILLNVQGSTTSNVNRYDRLTDRSAGQPTFAQWYYGPQNRFLADLSYKNYASNRFYDQIAVNVNIQDIEESRHTRRLGNSAIKSQVERVKIYGGALHLRKSIGRNELDYGLDYTYNDVDSKATFYNYNTTTTTTADTRYPDGGSDMGYLGVYIAHRIKLSDKWILNDGIRYSNVQLNTYFTDKTFFPFPFSSASNNYAAVNFSLGTAYSFREHSRVFASFNTGFRAPNVDDLAKVFDSKSGENLIVPNPDLKAEYTYQSEVGFESTLSDYLKFGINAWYTILQNGLAVLPSKLAGQDSVLYAGKQTAVVSTQNVNRAYIAGLSLNIDGKITSHLGYSATASYTYARIRNANGTESPLDHIPPTYGRIGLNYQHSKWRAEVYSLFNAAKRLSEYSNSGEDNLQYATKDGMPSWYTINARVAYQALKYLNLQAACENIADQNYRVFASGISAPGRNFVVTARLNF